MNEATLERVAHAIRAHRFFYTDEDDLQAGIAGALESRGYTVRREVPLDRHNRIDIVVDSIGVEVKVAGSTSDVERQVARYLSFPVLSGLVLVTSRVVHLHVRPDPRLTIVTLAKAGL